MLRIASWREGRALGKKRKVKMRVSLIDSRLSVSKGVDLGSCLDRSVAKVKAVNECLEIWGSEETEWTAFRVIDSGDERPVANLGQQN